MTRVDASPATERLPRLSLFYPMYNEEANIEEAVRRALEILPRYAEEFEVILVNDGSQDRTREIAERLVEKDPRVRAVHHATNQGYGAALRSGLAASRYEWIFYTDGDNQFDLDDLRLLLPLLRDADIVSGYRIARRDPWHRRLNAWTFNRAMRILLGLKLRDVDCAFKIYRRSALEGCELRSGGAMIDAEILARARKRGARIIEVGVHHYPRTAGTQTGAKPAVILRAFRELFSLWTELR